MRFFVTSGKPAHRVGMLNNRCWRQVVAGHGNRCAVYCRVCFVAGEWLTHKKRVSCGCMYVCTYVCALLQ